MLHNTEENSLQKSLVYLVSRRGAANYWCMVVNGMQKQFTNEEGTLSVQLTPNWRYILTVHLPFFDSCSETMKRLALVHEAAHVCLQHIPRLFKLLANCTDPFVRTAILATFNWAADFSANDAIVRLEPGFKEAHKAFLHVNPDGSPVHITKEEMDKLPGEWPFLLPEEYGFPTGLSMEEYFVLILKDLPKFKQRIERMMQDLAEQIERMGDGDGDGDGDGEGEPKEGEGPPKPGKGRRGGKGGGSGLPDSIPGLPDALIDHALNSPETFEMLQKAFDKISGKAHRQWNEKAQGMTPEEAISAGNKMKKHAQALARSANERVTRDRGFLHGNVQRIIDALLEPEQIPWDMFLKDLIQGAITARVQEEMVSPNLSLINEDYLEPWPGQTLEFGFNITWMTDTSGSMGDNEYARACACINSLLAQNKSVFVTYVECDAALQKEVKVSNVEPPDEVYLKELQNRRGHGGTVYTPFFKRVAGLDAPGDWVLGAPRLDEKHPKPDLMVICTDGGVALEGECFPQYRPDCPIIWLLMPGCRPCAGMDNIAPDRLVEMFKMKEE
jgi:predicted metal-dependent peptidase